MLTFSKLFNIVGNLSAHVHLLLFSWHHAESLDISENAQIIEDVGKRNTEWVEHKEQLPVHILVTVAGMCCTRTGFVSESAQFCVTSRNVRVRKMSRQEMTNER